MKQLSDKLGKFSVEDHLQFKETQTHSLETISDTVEEMIESDVIFQQRQDEKHKPQNDTSHTPSSEIHNNFIQHFKDSTLSKMTNPSFYVDSFLNIVFTKIIEAAFLLGKNLIQSTTFQQIVKYLMSLLP